MKVLLVNGSPHEKGCTYTALAQIASALNAEGVETEIFHIGTKPVFGCTACGKCSSNRCVFDDVVNKLIERAQTADGYIFGSPVHYAAPAGVLTAALDRAFYAASSVFAYKPGAAIVSCRRGGATAAFDRLSKYFTISNMPVVSSQYWNMVHGTRPEEVLEDREGMQIMRTLGRNMAWLLKSIEAGRNAGISIPAPEKREMTNFIR